MNHNLTALERAFQLAQSGDCVSVEAIKTQLKGEGYSVAHVAGPTLRKQLHALIKAAQAQPPLP